MSESWRLEVDLTELRNAIGLALDRIEDVNGSTVSIPADYFWSVPSPDAYDVNSAPQLTVGQLSETWDNLRRERERDGEGTIAYTAVWLGDVLKAIGHHSPA